MNEKEEEEKLVDGEEDSRSKSFSTLLYEDKVLLSRVHREIPRITGPSGIFNSAEF